MTGVYEIRPAQWWDWPFRGIRAFEESSIPAVTTLPASDEDQRAVTVRFSYPSPATATPRGTLLADGLPTGFVVEFDRAGGVWRLSGSAGDTPNSGEKADTASGFVTGSCPLPRSFGDIDLRLR